MNFSIRQRIYWGFSLLILLLVLFGTASLITLSKNKKLSARVSTVINPSIEGLESFKYLVIKSDKHTINSIFLHSNTDKKELNRLCNNEYPALKQKLNGLIQKWENKQLADSLNKMYDSFEEVIALEKQILSTNDVSIQQIEELAPKTSSLTNALSVFISYQVNSRNEINKKVSASFASFRLLVFTAGMPIIVIGLCLMLFVSKVIITPLNKIRDVVNELGKGIIKKLEHTSRKDEINEMSRSLNRLSENLHSAAAFVTEIGNRNYYSEYEPLSLEDTLGVALVNMRNNIRVNDEKLNDAQHIAHTGSWERNIKTDKISISDEMFNIFDITPGNFDYRFESLMEFVHPDDKENAIDLNRKNLYMNPVPYECRIVTSKGELKHVLIQTKVVLGEFAEIEKTFGIVQDITARKLDEQMLKKSEKTLETKNKELENKNRELEQFAYVASHDLQEPLRTTTSFVNMFKQQYYGKIDAKADQLLKYIVQASDRMSVLIKDLLDFARIGDNKDIEQVDCNKILNDVVADIDQAIKESHAEIEASNLPTITGYSTELKQLFHNLITNSIKFRKKEVPPKIKIVAEKNKDFWRFAFTDNGIGIEKQHSERIFIIFQRLHNRTVYQGSGIGLSHCKKIVELHNGKIWVDSTPNVGSTFNFTIQAN
jgi:signal transduction histidine kinase/HAMP domain-containing protein